MGFDEFHYVIKISEKGPLALALVLAFRDGIGLQGFPTQTLRSLQWGEMKRINERSPVSFSFTCTLLRLLRNVAFPVLLNGCVVGGSRLNQG